MPNSIYLINPIGDCPGYFGTEAYNELNITPKINIIINNHKVK